MQSSTDQRPILVTGAHRSGTTWVGKMLAASRQVTYVSEPLNVWHRPGVMSAPVRHWYTYICSENELEYLSAFQDTLRLRYQLWAEIRSLASLRDLARMGRDASAFWSGRLLHKRALLKDPFAVFSIPWFRERFGCAVVVVVRHPAAFASSLVRLGWSFDFTDLLAQPLLLRDWLADFQPEIAFIQKQSQDILGQACLLWKMIYRVVSILQARMQDLLVVRHEDLSMDPVESFERLYRLLGLRFHAHARRTIVQSSNAENPNEPSLRRVHSVRVDSRASLQNWKRRLSQEEIARVRHLTEEVAGLYYSAEEWE